MLVLRKIFGFVLAVFVLTCTESVFIMNWIRRASALQPVSFQPFGPSALQPFSPSALQPFSFVSSPHEGDAAVGARKQFHKPSKADVQKSTNNNKVCIRAFPTKGTPRANIFTNLISQLNQLFKSSKCKTLTTYATSEQHRATQHIAMGSPREMFLAFPSAAESSGKSLLNNIEQY
jgi:hypothetical protein